MLRPTALSACFALILAGCASTPPAPSAVTRNVFDVDPSLAQERILTGQAHALTEMTHEIQRKAALKGAALGALTGCGLSVLSQSARSKCLTGAVTGGALGAAFGYVQGQKDVQKRVDAGALGRLKPAMVAANAKMDDLGATLPDVLASQDAEIAQLKAQHRAGSISKSAYDARLSDIRAHRMSIAQALTMSAQQLAEAQKLLQDGDDQDGLAWYLHKVKKLEQDTMSARSKISLL